MSRRPPRPPDWPEMTFVAGVVRVNVPATSANLGPGYDSLGLALQLYNRFDVEIGGYDPALPQIEVHGELGATLSTGPDNL